MRHGDVDAMIDDNVADRNYINDKWLKNTHPRRQLCSTNF